MNQGTTTTRSFGWEDTLAAEPSFRRTRQSVDPVSYTHLDVYKRQVERGVRGSDQDDHRAGLPLHDDVGAAEKARVGLRAS